ncbi:hypothetical protein TYRP_011288 [Tyrophagus putrescentiae]|nr:hypothetical protein TYRP_011288 [Tyrophagus putrescentiae]
MVPGGLRSIIVFSRAQYGSLVQLAARALSVFEASVHRRPATSSRPPPPEAVVVVVSAETVEVEAPMMVNRRKMDMDISPIVFACSYFSFRSSISPSMQVRLRTRTQYASRRSVSLRPSLRMPQPTGRFSLIVLSVGQYDS